MVAAGSLSFALSPVASAAASAPDKPPIKSVPTCLNEVACLWSKTEFGGAQVHVSAVHDHGCIAGRKVGTHLRSVVNTSSKALYFYRGAKCQGEPIGLVASGGFYRWLPSGIHSARFMK
jgi:hypothetical protein